MVAHGLLDILSDGVGFANRKRGIHFYRDVAPGLSILIREMEAEHWRHSGFKHTEFNETGFKRQERTFMRTVIGCG